MIFFPENEELNTRDCLLPLTIDGKRTSDVVQSYLENGIVTYDRVRTNPMSRRILDSLKLDEIVRVTPIHCNNKREVEKFLKVTQNIVSNT